MQCKDESLDVDCTTEVELLQLASGTCSSKGNLSVVIWAPDCGITSILYCISCVDRFKGFYAFRISCTLTSENGVKPFIGSLVVMCVGHLTRLRPKGAIRIYCKLSDPSQEVCRFTGQKTSL